MRLILVPGVGGQGQKGCSIAMPVKGKGSPDVARRRHGRIDMKINCLSCGFKVDLDETYDDFEGPIKCLCGALLEIRTEEGMLKAIKMGERLSHTVPKPKRMERAATT